MRQVVRLVARVALMGCCGCVLFTGAGAPVVAPEPEPEPQAPVVAPPVVEAPVAQVEAPPAPPPVEVAELRATLGETADSVVVRSLVDRLGAPEIRGTAAEPIQAFAEHGVFLRYVDGRVAEVALFSAGERRSTYRGTLPGGLRFGMSAGDVESALGVRIPHREVGRRDNTRVFHAAIDGGRTFRGHGLRAHFGRDRGLSFVVLLPDAAPGRVYLDDAFAYPGEESGVHGLRVYYQLSAADPACAGVDVELRLADAAAAPVRARGVGRGKAAEVFKMVEEDVACRAEDRMLFVPFGDLELPVGRQELRLQLAARSVKERAKRGKAAVVAAVSAPASVEMPAVVLVRLKVRAGIHGDVFSRRNTIAMLTFGISALGSRPKLSPDPFWVMQAGRHHHRSKTRPNTFTPRWAESTQWFPLAEGDVVTLYFADEDVGDNERLATFRLGVEQLRAAVREKVVLSADWVESLVLEGSEIRED